MSSTSKIGNQGVLDAYGGLCISIKVKGQIPRQFMSIAWTQCYSKDCNIYGYNSAAEIPDIAHIM